jgi:hypothetical protein
MTHFRLTTLAVLALFLAACGGGSSNSDGPTTPPPAAQPTNLTAAGTLTGFGSIYVNGIEFETGSATYEVDDVQGNSDSDLSVGMFVRVSGTVNADGVSGTAESVSYDDEIEGPVENLMADPDDASRKIFSVFDTQVIISAATIFRAEDGSAFGFETIANGDNVEVSGDIYGDAILATYVELQEASDDEYEVKGTITELFGDDQFTLTLNNGVMLNVELDIGAEIPDVGLMLEQYVEVEGRIPDPVGAPNDILATKVELEDQDSFDDEDDEVEIKGPLTHNEDGSWKINTTMLVFSETTEYEPESLADAIADGSADGRVVEAEGHYVEGVLHVDELEDEEDDLEFKAQVDAVVAGEAKNGTITVVFGAATGGKDGEGRLDIIVNGSTLYMDDDATTQFDLMSLMPGTYVEIHAHQDDVGNIIASTFEIEDSAEFEIEGPVDEISEMSISIMTIVYVIGDETVFTNGIPVMGDYASVEDHDGNGVANFVELDD